MKFLLAAIGAISLALPASAEGISIPHMLRGEWSPVHETCGSARSKAGGIVIAADGTVQAANGAYSCSITEWKNVAPHLSGGALGEWSFRWVCSSDLGNDKPKSRSGWMRAEEAEGTLRLEINDAERLGSMDRAPLDPRLWQVRRCEK